MDALRLGIVKEDRVLTLESIKEHLIVDHDDDDDYILALLQSATRFAERRLEKTLLLRNLTAHATCWPCNGLLTIPFGPVRQITAVRYVDCDEVEQLVSVEDWNAAPVNGIDRLLLCMSQPSLSSKNLRLIQVDYIAGYGLIDGVDDGYEHEYPVEYGIAAQFFDDLPENIEHAIKMTIGHWYENRETVVVGTGANEVPLAAKHLLDQERILGL